MKGATFLAKITDGEQAKSDLHESIREHIGMLLNTRRGMTPHLPDYGLPDIHRVYVGLPRSIDQLAETIREVILRYEPRLEQVRVRRGGFAKDTFRATFLISGNVRDGSRVSKLTFRTEIHRDGSVRSELADRHG